MDVETSGGDSIRDSISAAFDAVENRAQDTPGENLPPPIIAPEKAEPAQPTKPAPETPEGPGPEPKRPGEEHPAKQGERTRDPSGKFAKAGNTAPPKPGEQSATPQPAPPQTSPASDLRAPPTWKATARERWASLPPEVQTEVKRREREIDIALDQTAEARRTAQAFRELVGPYEGMLKAEGLDPLRAVGNLVQTWAGLRTAPIPHRAQIVAGLIHQSGVPLETINAALSGEAPQTGAQNPQAAYQDPRVDQLMAQLQQAAYQRQTAIQQKSVSEVSKFGESREFFEDVRETMADMLEVAAKRGVELSLEDAYNAAIASPLHKEIAEVVRQREAARPQPTAQAATARAKAASSSVRSQPAGASRSPQNLSPYEERRADIESALAEVDGR